jgi:hypothetical protein
MSFAYTLCRDCGRRMAPDAGCNVDRITVDGIGYPRVPMRVPDGAICPDCNVTPGQQHHPRCREERCPVCLDPLSTCPHHPIWTPVIPPTVTEDLWTLPLSERGKVHLVSRSSAAFLLLDDAQQLTGLWLTREEAYRLAQALLTWVDET